jgi:hypothetical protein
MDRRDFCNSVFLSTFLYVAGPASGTWTQEPGRPTVIDAHCHAGKGINYGKSDQTSDPWTTYNDPRWTLTRAAEVGIDKTIIFPINNTTYREANEEIASYVRRCHSWRDSSISLTWTAI